MGALDPVNITMANIKQLTVTSASQGLPYGRRFNVVDKDNHAQLFVMKELFQQAKNLSKSTSNPKELKLIYEFVEKLEKAETAGILEYENRDDSLYKFRSFWHRLFGGAFFGSHLDRISSLKDKITEKIGNPSEQEEPQEVEVPKLMEPQELEVPEINPAQEQALKKTADYIISKQAAPAVFKNLSPAPENVRKWPTAELKAFINKHPALSDVNNKNKNNNTIKEELKTAYYYGLNSFPQAIQETYMELLRDLMEKISKAPEEEQAVLVEELALGFSGCQAGMASTIERMRTRFSAGGFQDQLKSMMTTYKRQILEDLIVEDFPDARTYTAMDPVTGESIGEAGLELIHLTNGYLDAIGESVGLTPIPDKDKYDKTKLDSPELERRFKELFNKNLPALCTQITEVWNYSGTDSSLLQQVLNPFEFGSWFRANKADHNLADDLAYYSPDKEAEGHYEGLKEATDDQQMANYLYVSPLEVCDILVASAFLTNKET